MLIDVLQIPPEGVDVDLPEEELDIGSSAQVWEGAATVRATMHIGRSGRGLLISGEMVGQIALLCSRCLERFPFRSEERLALYCETAGTGQSKQEIELSPDDLDVTYLEEGRIDTDRLLRESVLLSLPVQPLCREDCRGLCPRCGANLNHEACSCAPPQGDLRFQALRKLR
ncbi:MAG: DUF177 domain-containing protein [candidate division NC10 bacterium]|nr:DUF177 domain-containing protein [candidate division NC10 bacterium]